nr:aspartokinase 1, chloroplastic-like [Setaria viridis]
MAIMFKNQKITTDDFTNADILEVTYPAVAKRLHGDWMDDPAIPIVTGFLGKYIHARVQVFSIFEDLGISVDCVATSEVSISLTLDPSKLWSRELIQQELDHVVEELEKFAVVHLLQRRSIISLVGNVQRSSLILEKPFNVLRRQGVNVQMISQGASKVNISLVFNDSEAKQCASPPFHSLRMASCQKSRELMFPRTAPL